MVGCSPQLVRWIRKQVQRPPSRYARMDAQLQAVCHQVARLTEIVERIAKQQLGLPRRVEEEAAAQASGIISEAVAARTSGSAGVWKSSGRSNRRLVDRGACTSLAAHRPAAWTNPGAVFI